MDSKWIFGLIYLLCAALLLLPGGESGAAEPPPESTGTAQTSPETAGRESETIPSALQTSPTDTRPDTLPTVTVPATTETGTAPQTEVLPPKPAHTIQVYLSDQEQVVEMDLEEYVTRVVMAEVPYTFHIEALKAQAVAARTYCLYRIVGGITHGDTEAGVCTSYAHCMAYFSPEQAAERWGEEAEAIYTCIAQAVAETRGQVMTWDGRLIAALFHSSSSGNTENAEALWGNRYPYLVSVESGEDVRISEMTVSLTELKQLLRTEGEADFAGSLWEVDGGIGLRYNKSGRIAYLTLDGYRMAGNDLRMALGLKSTDFSVSLAEDGETVVFTVTGNGHGLGMSQYGAQHMAEQGADHAQILTHYYSGVTLCDWEAVQGDQS